LTDDFDRAALAMLDTPGRVIVSGMGKSGHVARKIAATLSSTGTPAFFVHPSEAAHGDLGMIAPGDLVLALSNSGRTAELDSIIEHTRRRGIPLIAMTKAADSPLARHADGVLTLPDAAEACPHNLAPTSSTTMMMAMGDALALALMEMRGFSPQDFGRLHPGGALGRRLLSVGELMHTGAALPLVATGRSVGEALITMSEKGFGVAGIHDRAERLIGVITDGDLRRHMGDGLPKQPVEAVMTATPQTIGADALAAEALSVMNGRAITCLFVVDESDRPVGLIHVHDCLRAGIA
jgi:arabinose-5-phosphate isomerase